MPITTKLDSVTQRLTSRVTGNLSYEDLLNHLQTTKRSMPAGHSDLIDARGAYTDLTQAQVSDLAQTAKNAGAQIPGATAIVTTNNVLFGMARMFEMLNDGHLGLISVFRDLAAATAWLESTEERQFARRSAAAAAS